MVLSQQITPGTTIKFGKKLFLVESVVKVTVAKGPPFIKSSLRDLATNKVMEKNFKVSQEVEEVALNERRLEFLYMDGKDYLFLDIDSLEQILVPGQIISDKVNFLKEGTVITASFYGDVPSSVELPQFMELMISRAEGSDDMSPLSNATKVAILETGAKIDVPLFIEVGDIIKVDTKSFEYIQRV